MRDVCADVHIKVLIKAFVLKIRNKHKGPVMENWLNTF